MGKTFKEQRAAVRGAPMRQAGSVRSSKDLATARGRMPSRNLDAGMKTLPTSKASHQGWDAAVQPEPRRRWGMGKPPMPYYEKD